MLWKKSEIKAKYAIGEVLGTGNFAEVRLGVNKQTGDKVAIKVIKAHDSKENDLIQAEIEILGKLSHPNIVGLIDIFEGGSSKNKKVFIVMELVTGGELFDRIVNQKTFTEMEARGIIKDVLLALEYMHEKGVVHRDLKPENLLFASPEPNSPVKIADFGLAKLYDPEGTQMSFKTMCGTPGYVAPEVLKSKVQHKGYDSQVDMWSTGVILYILLCGFPPFYDQDQQDLFKKIVKGKFSFPKPHWDGISEEAKDLVRACLKTDPAERITASEALNHPWIVADESSLSSVAIDTKNLAQYRRRRKFRRVRDAILAVGRFQCAARRLMEPGQ